MQDYNDNPERVAPPGEAPSDHRAEGFEREQARREHAAESDADKLHAIEATVLILDEDAMTYRTRRPRELSNTTEALIGTLLVVLLFSVMWWFAVMWWFTP